MYEYINGLISIVVPCYNHEEYIDDFLDSVLGLSYDKIELLLCDDCSDDATFEIAKKREKELTSELENVVIIRNDVNLGCCKTINRLVGMARGEYIKPFASDDMLRADYAEKTLDLFMDDKRIDVVFTNGFMVEQGSHFKSYINEKEIYDSEPDLSLNTIFERLYCNNFVFSPSMIIRHRTIDKYGCYNEDGMTDDWELLLRFSLHGCIFGFVNTNAVYYRISDNSASSLVRNQGFEKRRIDRFRAELKVIDCYGKYMEKCIYQRRKINYIFSAKHSAEKNKLPNLKLIVDEELNSFRNSAKDENQMEVLKGYLRYYYMKFMDIEWIIVRNTH